MYNKKLSKIYKGCALAMALTIAAAPVSAFAADPVNKEVNSVNPGTDQTGKDTKADEAKKLTGIDPTKEDKSDTTDVYEGYVDTDIDVWGYTNDATVYSVDVEWGAMTFEYEASSWDPEQHKSKAGRGWLVYDNTTDKVLLNEDGSSDVQNAINRVTITNHSNASVYAKLSYTGESGTSGEFANSAKAAEENVKATWDDTNKYFTLLTAATDASGAAVSGDEGGAAAKGNVYFKPKNITADQTLEKWTTIGKITVAISTTAPTP